MQKQVYWFNNYWIRILFHLLFFSLSFYILLSLFKTGSRAGKIDYIYTGLFLLSIIPAVYINLKLLLPKFAKEGRWHWYIVSIIILVIVFSWINLEFFQTWSSRLLPDYFFISYYEWWEVVLFFFAFLAITTLLKLSKSWFMVNDLNRQLLVAEKQKVQMELKALKAQINPHFFFNTLNGIYSMSLDKDERLPHTILQLSELMRYFLYDSKEDLVPLKKELVILADYIALQKIRSNEKLQIETSFSGSVDDQKIAPLLLITFLENAFKHGAKGSVDDAFIRMNVQVHEKQLNFHLENNKGTIDDSTTNEYKGMGLANVKRRLELIYPAKHELRFDESNDRFIVQLQLSL